MGAVSETRARGTLTLKRRRITLVPPVAAHALVVVHDAQVRRAVLAEQRAVAEAELGGRPDAVGVGRRDADVLARVVDDGAERARRSEGLVELGEDRVARRGLADVAADALDGAAVGLREFRRRRRRRVGVAVVGQEQVEALRRERLGDALADAARAPRDDGHVLVEGERRGRQEAEQERRAHGCVARRQGGVSRRSRWTRRSPRCCLTRSKELAPCPAFASTDSKACSRRRVLRVERLAFRSPTRSVGSWDAGVGRRPARRQKPRGGTPHIFKSPLL